MIRHPTGPSAVPSPSITMVRSTRSTPRPSTTDPQNKRTKYLQSLTLHRRRMQRNHVILLEMHQVSSWIQRPRVSQPFQIVPLMSHGPVGGLFSLSYVLWPSLHVTSKTNHTLDWSSKGEGGSCDTDLSCVLDQVIGKPRLERRRAAREDRNAPLSLLLSVLERLSCRIGIVPAY
jgi:hypothetical protein